MNIKKSAKNGKYPQEHTRLLKLQSSTLRTQEWSDPPSPGALAALEAHANIWAAAIRHGRPVAPVMADRRAL